MGDAAIVELARGGLARMWQIDNDILRIAAPALRAGWQARGILKRAVKLPSKVAAGRLQVSGFSRRGQLLLKSAFGRW